MNDETIDAIDEILWDWRATLLDETEILKNTLSPFEIRDQIIELITNAE